MTKKETHKELDELLEKRREIQLHYEIEVSFFFLRRFHNLTSGLLKNECSMALPKEANLFATLEYEFGYARMLTTYYPYSFLILLYSNIEKAIKSICGYFKETMKLPFGIDSLNGPLGMKMKNYFSAFGINGINEEDIAKLNKLTKIRNSIVHDSGIVDKENWKLRELIKQERGIWIEVESNAIKIELEYCEAAIEYFGEMFLRLLETNNIHSWQKFSS